VLLIGISGYFYFKRTTLPQTTGRMALTGLAKTVSIQRELNGIVHIQAQTQADLFFAQGVVHAQDRLWQMEFQRRVGAGRLSEVLGEATLDMDKLLRTWGFYRAAEVAYTSLSATGKATIDAYVNGINAYLATNPPLSLEFQLLGFSPEPWTPADVMAWAKMMAFDLAQNRKTELKRYHLLAKGLSRERIAQLMPLYPEKGARLFSSKPVNTLLNPFSIRDLPRCHSPWGCVGRNYLKGKTQPNEADKKQAKTLLAMMEHLPNFAGASNNWVLGGSRTTSGKPLLANDPHLTLGIPSIWHLMHLEAPDYNVIGATLPGLPSIIIGRNAHIAWGVTNVEADVEDLYVLQETDDGNGYIYQNRVKPYKIRTETIHVKGSPSVKLNVRETVYGPVISDVVDIPEAAPLALRWMGHHPVDTTIEAYLALNKAQNWTEFKAALKHYVVPSQNFVYADVKSNIGYFAPGRLPIRKPSHTGLYPMPGNGEWDWQGFIPFEDLPEMFNPEQDYIFTANQNITPPDYPYTISLEWTSSGNYRAARIEQKIRSREKHSLADMLALQLDTISLLFQDFVPVLQQLTPTSARGQQWRERLLAWDGNMSLDSQEATVFHSWYVGLSWLTKPETGEEYWIDHPRYFLNAMLHSDIACEALKMTCVEYATQVLEQTLARWGDKIPAWGQLHQATFNHPILTNTPLAFFSDRKIPFGGCGYTVNKALYDPKDLRMVHGPSYRQVIDLAENDNSRYIHPMGQSGHLLSPHYDDLLPLWQQGEYLRQKTKDYPVAARLVLEPVVE
jgi:penicillin amidase